MYNNWLLLIEGFSQKIASECYRSLDISQITLIIVGIRLHSILIINRRCHKNAFAYSCDVIYNKSVNRANNRV